MLTALVSFMTFILVLLFLAVGIIVITTLALVIVDLLRPWRSKLPDYPFEEDQK